MPFSYMFHSIIKKGPRCDARVGKQLCDASGGVVTQGGGNMFLTQAGIVTQGVGNSFVMQAGGL